jgi:formate hydrogenlyase subunit 3/multisubunit Na+/H+ antiporter MnhD subunit
MPLLPVLAITLPLLGAGGTLVLSPLPRVRPYTRYITLMAVSLTTILLLAFGWMEAVAFVPSLWQPSLLFGATLALQSDATVQPLAVALALVTCSAVLVELSRTEKPNPRLMATLQALLAAGFVALWAANLLTMAVSWAIYDLLQAAGNAAIGGSARTAVRSLIFGNLATLLLWGGALLSGGGAGSQPWSLMTPSGAQLTLWALAGMLRLWVYPFHLFASGDLGVVSPLAAPLSLGPVVGWGLWLRLLLANSGSMPDDTWVPILAAVTLAMGGFLAWSCESLRRMSSWVGMGATGALLLAAGLAGENASAVIVAGSVAWALGVGVMFLSDGLQRDAPWWTIPALVGALTLLGLPLTLGFVSEATLVGGLTKWGHLGLGSAFFVGNVFLVPSLVRGLLASPSSPLPDRRWLAVARGLGLGLPMLVLVVAGLHPSLLVGGVQVPALGALLAMPGLMGWLLWAVSLAVGGVLAWQEGAIRPRVGLLLAAVHDLLRLEWLYAAVVGALDRGLGVLRAADEVVGGGGALLWSWLLFLLLILVWGSR